MMENSIIPIGSIVKITDKSFGDLYINYGVVDKYTSAGKDNLEQYSVLGIFEDQRQYKLCCYSRQLEIVYPETVAPSLWNSIVGELDNCEKINLAHVILEQSFIIEGDFDLLHSFEWIDSKQGYNYWSNVNKRINLNS